MKRIYRVLLRLYPARFREDYAASMDQQFSDEYRETGNRVRLALRALADLALTLPVEIAREFWRDLRYAARLYRKRPLATCLAVAALALAIGVTTGIFSVMNALLIRSLPFQDPERLVELRSSPVGVLSRAPFQAWVKASPYLESAAGYIQSEMNLNTPQGAARAKLTLTTANFLRLLGTAPKIGRDFSSDEDIPGRGAVAVIGYGLWQQFFGGSPRALGATIRLNGAPFQVVGVAPPGFAYPGKTAVWVPSVYDLEHVPLFGAFVEGIIGRLKPSVSIAQASAILRTEVKQANGRAGYPYEAGMLSLRDQLAGPVRTASLVLMGMALFVLLIACANVAHLLLTRTTERHHELALRAALGASRARLVQQLITEATVLTGTAAVIGLAVAHWTARLAAATQPAPLATREYTVLDWRVLTFALGLALLTGLIFGVLPALLIGRMQPGHDAIRTQAGSGLSGASRLRGLLIASQAALTVALVAGAFSMGRGFLKLMGTDLGFRTHSVVTLSVSLSGTRFETDQRQQQYYSDALERLRAVPGVESVGAVSYLPLIEQMVMSGSFKLDSGSQAAFASLIAATPGYFRTMGIEVIEGRDFTGRDREGAERVVIVSEAFAREFGSGSPLGRKVNLAPRGTPQMNTIVGVVRAPRHMGPLYGGAPQIFSPIEQAPPGFATFAVKVHGDPEAYLAACRDAVQSIDREIPVYDVKTMDQRLADTLARPRFYTTAMLFLAGFALLLAVAGTYGAATYSVSQRTHEIGVRIAVGAPPHRVIGMLFCQSMLPVGAGLVAGVFAAAGLGRFLQHLIASAEPMRNWICVTSASVLAAVTAVAVWAAVNRIVRMNPTDALRIE